MTTRTSSIQFHDASSALEKNIPSSSYGVTIFDIDGDGEPEILIANSQSENLIYKYHSEKKCFVDVAPEAFKEAQKATLSLCVGDFLGTGQGVVYMLHSDAFSGFKKHSDNLFARVSQNGAILQFDDLFLKNPQMSNPYAGRSVAAVDFKGSGDHGFYVANFEAPSLFYAYNKSTKKIEELSKEMGVRQVSGGRSILAQYIVNDKALDIFVGNEDGPNSLFTRSSTDTYREVAKHFNLADRACHARGMAIADFNGNGLADIVLGTWEGSNSIFIQKSKNEFCNLPPAFFSEPQLIRSVIVADFDNDGHEEVFVNTYGSSNRMFRYLTQDEWEEVDIGPLALNQFHGTGAAVGDLTGNGFLDLFVTTGEKEKQENKLFIGVPNRNSWLRVQPLTRSGFPALGAKVRLYMKGGPHQTKYICGGSGYLCQMEPVAHFGLGFNPRDIDRLEITWPGNGRDRPHTHSISGQNLNLNTFIQVPHPTSIL